MTMRAAFGVDEATAAGEAWGFNCGPGALCAVLQMTPETIRPHLLSFESKGYTNPTLMLSILAGLGVRSRSTYRSDEPQGKCTLAFGLMRVQWGGPWTRPGVPMAARYRQTHWVAVRGHAVFDINALCVGGWISSEEWAGKLVPWLIRECCPKGSGEWWPTHGIEIDPASVRG